MKNIIHDLKTEINHFKHAFNINHFTFTNIPVELNCFLSTVK